MGKEKRKISIFEFVRWKKEGWRRKNWRERERHLWNSRIPVYAFDKRRLRMKLAGPLEVVRASIGRWLDRSRQSFRDAAITGWRWNKREFYSIRTYSAGNYLNRLDGKKRLIRFVSRSTIRDGIQPSAIASKSRMVYPFGLKDQYLGETRSIFVVILENERRKISTTSLYTATRVRISLPLLLFLLLLVTYRNEEIFLPERGFLPFILPGKGIFKYSFSRKKRSERKEERKEGRKIWGGRKRTFAFLAQTISSSFVSFSLSVERSFFFSGHAQEWTRRGGKSKEGVVEERWKEGGEEIGSLDTQIRDTDVPIFFHEQYRPLSSSAPRYGIQRDINRRGEWTITTNG